MADWFEQIRRKESFDLLMRVKDAPLVAELLDVPRLESSIKLWPTSGWEGLLVISEYRLALMRALSAAHFLALVGWDGNLSCAR